MTMVPHLRGDDLILLEFPQRSGRSMRRFSHSQLHSHMAWLLHISLPIALCCTSHTLLRAYSRARKPLRLICTVWHPCYCIRNKIAKAPQVISKCWLAQAAVDDWLQSLFSH